MHKLNFTFIKIFVVFIQNSAAGRNKRGKKEKGGTLLFTGINHIGIVVKDIDTWVDFLSRAFGAQEVGRVDLPEMGQCSCVMAMNGQNVFELMMPIGETGVVAKYLATHGEGFHHISVKTDAYEADTQRLHESGVKTLSEVVLRGGRMSFTHPKTSQGILFEIAEQV